jgi:hypothetical protein
VAYQGNVTIEAGAGATGIDTYYDNFTNGDARVNRGDVLVRGTVSTSAGDSSGSGNVDSGGSVLVDSYDAGAGDFGNDGFVSGSVASRRSATVNGVVLGSLSAYNSFDGTGDQNVIVKGFVGGKVTAGGVLTVADHHVVPGNVNDGAYVNGVYANGYVGGGAEVHGRNGTGPSVISGFVTGGSLYVHSPAKIVIDRAGRVNTIDSSPGVTVDGALAIEALGELDANDISEIYANGPLNAIYVFAHAEGLKNGGRLGPAGSGVIIAKGAKIYTRDPIVVPDAAALDFDKGTGSGGSAAPAVQEARFKALAASAVVHTNAASSLSSLGSAAAPLALAVGAYNSVTLTQNTTLIGSVAVNGLLRLNGHELTADGASITLASVNSDMLNYGSGDYVNGCLSFETRLAGASSLKFNGNAASLNGLSPSTAYKPSYDAATGNPNSASPVVAGVETPYNGGSFSVAATFVTSPATAAGGPVGGAFTPGSGAELRGSSSGSHYISKDSRYVWTFGAP